MIDNDANEIVNSWLGISERYIATANVDAFSAYVRVKFEMPHTGFKFFEIAQKAIKSVF